MAVVQKHLGSSQQAYEVLKRRILSMELLPCAPLGEQKLAGELGISRTPIREALMRLASEGLVELVPNRGGMVAPIRLDFVSAAQFVRESLETAIAHEASQKIDAIGELSLRQTIEEQKLANREGAVELFYQSDERMHRRISEIAGRPLVWQHIVDAKSQMDRARRLNLQGAPSFDALISQHERIINALVAKDADEITQAMHEHLRQILPDMKALQESNPEYFAVND